MGKPKHGDWLSGYTEERSGFGMTQGRIGWVYNENAFGEGKGGWVQMGPGGPTGVIKKYATDTNLVSGTINTIGRVSKFGLKWLTPLGPTIRAIEKLKIKTVPLHENFSDSSEEVGLLGAGGKTNSKSNLNQSNLTSNKTNLTSNTSNKGRLMFGVPLKEWQSATKNERQLYKRLSNNRVNSPAITLNKVSNINPSIKDIKAGNVRNAWFTGRGEEADEKWEQALDVLRHNHEEWLREKGRIK